MKRFILLGLVLGSVLSGCAMNPAHETKYDKESVHQLIEAHAKDLRACYVAQLKANPKLAGRMVFSWDIVDEGVSKNVALQPERSTLRNSAMEACIGALIASWKFTPPPPRQTVTVSYPFSFKN